MDSGDLLAELLIGHGVRYVFGIPGGQTRALYTACADRTDRLQHILIRDERTGPYAADAYARVAGKLAVCDAVPGPGVVKLPSGLWEAYSTSMPLIAVAGDIRTDWRLMAPYSCAAQGLDQVNLLRPVCKSVISVPTQALLPAAVRQAFREATTGRPGPVVLDIPDDVLHSEWNPEDLPARSDARYAAFPADRARPASEATSAAAKALLSAERPVIAAGGGVHASHAYEELASLAEALNAPVATTVTGKGAIGEEHPLSVGVWGSQYGDESANTVVREADLIFLVGNKCSQQTTCGWQIPTPRQRVIHLDVDPYETGKVFPTEVAMVGDAASGLDDLLRAVKVQLPRPPSRETWLARVADVKARWKAEKEGEIRRAAPIKPQQVMFELQRQMDLEDTLVMDASFSVGWGATFYQIRKARRGILFPRGSATLGFGIPATIGARLASPPEQRVVCVGGDGGMNYAISELATCRKYDLRVTLVILNNGAFGYNRWGERLRGGRFDDVEFSATDFAAIARGYGCDGIRVEGPDELGDVLAKALAADGPVVVDVAVDGWETPELVLRRQRSALPR
ncbi:MAG: thiamine pyrophosphate-binding protein [Chloroflexota bacterium]